MSDYYEAYTYREPSPDDPVYVWIAVMEHETMAEPEHPGYVHTYHEECRITIGYPTKKVERWCLDQELT